MNSYDLSRAWFDFSFSNPDKVKPIHSAIFFFAIEHCNRLGWKKKFGFPSQMVMEAVGVKNWRTYSSGLKDLVDFGFIEMIEISKNQYSSNVIAIVNFTKAQSKALDKALQKHSQKHSKSTVSINKQENKEQGTKNNVPEFSEFLKYAKEKKPNVCGQALKLKYEAWKINDWKDGNDNEIKNWKSKINHTLAYIKENTYKSPTDITL